jgi:hypothetical protein
MTEAIAFKTYIMYIVEELATEAYILNVSKLDLQHIAYTELILYKINNIKSYQDLQHLVMKSRLWLKDFSSIYPKSSKKMKHLTQ